MRNWIFKQRGAIMAVMAAVILIAARPTRCSWSVGIVMAVLGEAWRLYALGYSGEPTRSSELNAPKLWTQGPYALSRNPLYVGNCLNGLGVAWAASGAYALPCKVLLVCVALAVLLGVYGSCISAEERFLRDKFGDEYYAYCREVPRWWPHWRRGWWRTGETFAWSSWRFEAFTLLWWLLIWLFLWWRVL